MRYIIEHWDMELDECRDMAVQTVTDSLPCSRDRMLWMMFPHVSSKAVNNIEVDSSGQVSIFEWSTVQCLWGFIHSLLFLVYSSFTWGLAIALHSWIFRLWNFLLTHFCSFFFHGFAIPVSSSEGLFIDLISYFCLKSFGIFVCLYHSISTCVHIGVYRMMFSGRKICPHYLQYGTSLYV